MADGYWIQEQRQGGWQHFADYGTDEPGAVSSCRWYNSLCRKRRVFRVVLSIAGNVAVIHG